MTTGEDQVHYQERSRTLTVEEQTTEAVRLLHADSGGADDKSGRLSYVDN